MRQINLCQVMHKIVVMKKLAEHFCGFETFPVMFERFTENSPNSCVLFLGCGHSAADSFGCARGAEEGICL